MVYFDWLDWGAKGTSTLWIVYLYLFNEYGFRFHLLGCKTQKWNPQRWKATRDCEGVVHKLQPRETVYRLNELKYVWRVKGGQRLEPSVVTIRHDFLSSYIMCLGEELKNHHNQTWSGSSLREGLVCLTNRVIYLTHVSAHMSQSSHSPEELC